MSLQRLQCRLSAHVVRERLLEGFQAADNDSDPAQQLKVRKPGLLQGTKSESWHAMRQCSTYLACAGRLPTNFQLNSEAAMASWRVVEDQHVWEAVGDAPGPHGVRLNCPLHGVARESRSRWDAEQQKARTLAPIEASNLQLLLQLLVLALLWLHVHLVR